MNWLAHLYLSESDVESRLGNLLADMVKGSARQELNLNIKRGIECHHCIDAFTDSHPIVKDSKQRIDLSYRRFAGILIDVFYDHFLAKNWSEYSSQALGEFTAEVYESFQLYQGKIPAPCTEAINRMIAEDWLGTYRTVDGIEYTLWRISKRFERRVNKDFMLNKAVTELKIHYLQLEDDFREYFPQLRSHTQNWSTTSFN